MILAAGALLLIGYLALGALVQLLVGDLATSLGLTGVIVSPAFGYAGVGFPTFGMNAFAQVWSAILPLRWYMAVLLGQAARDCRFPNPRARSRRWQRLPYSTHCLHFFVCAWSRAA